MYLFYKRISSDPRSNTVAKQSTHRGGIFKLPEKSTIHTSVIPIESKISLKSLISYLLINIFSLLDPACQAINRKLRCYILDPLCQPTGGDDTCSNDEMDPGNLNITLYVVMFCLGVAVGVLGLCVWKKYGKCFKGL